MQSLFLKQFDYFLAQSSACFDAVPQQMTVALSGGIDSVVLLHLLRVSTEQYPELQIDAAHIHHQIHDAADEQAQFCADLCASLSIPFSVYQIDWDEAALADKQAHGVEAAARYRRYALLSEHARQREQVVLTGHHRDDQAETILLNLARGSGLAGLSGLRDWQMLSQWSLCVGRPMLPFTKAEVLGYAKLSGLSWVEDPTNLEARYRRNYIRQHVLPSFCDMWPSFIETAARSAEHLASAREALADFSEEWLSRYASIDVLDLPAWRASSGAQQPVLLRAWLTQAGWSVPNTEKLNEFIRQVGDNKADSSAELAYRDAHANEWRCVIAERDKLWRLPELNAEAISALPTALSDNQQTIIALPVGSLQLRLEADMLDADVLAALSFSTMSVAELSIASKILCLDQPARIVLKKAFQQRNVPAWLRSHVPILQLNNVPIWIGEIGWVVPPEQRQEFIKSLSNSIKLIWQWRR